MLLSFTAVDEKGMPLQSLPIKRDQIPEVYTYGERTVPQVWCNSMELVSTHPVDIHEIKDDWHVRVWDKESKESGRTTYTLAWPQHFNWTAIERIVTRGPLVAHLGLPLSVFPEAFKLDVDQTYFINDDKSETDCVTPALDVRAINGAYVDLSCLTFVKLTIASDARSCVQNANVIQSLVTENVDPEGLVRIKSVRSASISPSTLRRSIDIV